MTAPPQWHRDGSLHFAVGVEDTFVPQAGPGQRPIDEYELTEHYAKWHADLGLASDAGAELVRWGVPWYRIQPEPGRWDWGWLDRVMDRFAELGLRPVVDLMHYGTPLWLEGQFANPDYPERVAAYSARVAERYAHLGFGDYTPVNEPMIHAQFSGEYAYWPPYLSGPEGLSAIVKQLGRGFVLAQRAMRDVLGDKAVFVHVDAGMRYVGDVEAPEHREHAARLKEQVHLVEDLVTGRVGGSHPLAPFLTAHGWSDEDLAWFAAGPVHPDVVGVNYYPLHSTEVFEAGVFHSGGFPDPRPARDDGTAGLVELLRGAAERYGAPVMLTETCVTDSVKARIDWLDESVAAVRDLRESGVDVVGYTWWPLFDMYEWTYRHSEREREAHRLTMGLWELQERGGDLARVETAVADRFRHHAAGGR
ncbi:family 1 glycosylhydrolase [Glycomyces harbinensis]|uniref:Beta-glucosidase/6-phospho-beta-glucosidase/beta-galactosidase n=1 Tax=Glycomyces harbinensis TaxID=58114 RepID=A0A1G6QYP1_9ACTN|nr:family 1 glycosylhydrolase [Glycomyces harbinensis]SDC97520.1 Beta-glucosidase/6-phospho-beta-glucosidase/beta-galactosidase [Glycomyces harbinensis]